MARLAETYGGGRIRTTTQQKLVILDVPQENFESLEQELVTLDLLSPAEQLAPGHDGMHRYRVLQARYRRNEGSRRRAVSLPRGEAPGYEDDIRINVNGCPNSCARYQTADIGLMGCLLTDKVYVMDHNGDQVEQKRKVEAFLVHLGGHLGTDRAFGKKARGVKVLASEVGPYVETLIRRYRRERKEDDTFASFVNSLSDEDFSVFSAKPKFTGLPPAPAVIAEPRAS